VAESPSTGDTLFDDHLSPNCWHFFEGTAAGNPMDFAACAIAAIATAHRFILATRNSKDFKGSGIELLDPWVTAK